MQNKLKGTNCRKIFQDYFTGRLDLCMKLCKMNIDSERFNGGYLSTYRHTYSVMQKQRQTLIKAFNELDEPTQTIIANSFKDDGQTAETLAYEHNIPTNDIRKLVANFKQSYAKHGGTDETEIQLLQPIVDMHKKQNISNADKN